MTDYADLRKRLDCSADLWEALGPSHLTTATQFREASAAIAALVRERDDLAREVLEAIEAEPEAPGEMPAELRMLPIEDVVRAAIRATKKGILARVAARLSPPPSVEGSK